MRTMSACCGLAVALLVAQGAAAAEPAREATAAQNEGVRAFEEGRFAQAAEHFQRAYALSPQPALLLAIARAAYRQGDNDRAKSCLFDFLRDDPKSLSASEAFDLLTRIEKESPATAHAASIPCLKPAAPPAPPATAGPAAAVAPPAPAAPAVAKPKGAVPWPAVQAAAAPEPRRHGGPVSYTSMGAAVVAAGLGTYFGLQNLSATSDWRNAATPQAIADAHDRAGRAARNANIAWVAAGVLAGTAAGLWLFTEF